MTGKSADIHQRIVRLGFERLYQGIRRVVTKGCRARIYYIPPENEPQNDFALLEGYVFILSDNKGHSKECTPCVEKVHNFVAEDNFQDLFEIPESQFRNKKSHDSNLIFLIRINEVNPKLIGFIPTKIIVRNGSDNLVAELVIKKDSPKGASVNKISNL